MHENTGVFMISGKVCLSWLIIAFWLAGCSRAPDSEPAYWGQSKEDAMFIAISRNNIALVQKLLNEGVKPDAVIGVRYGDRPLHVAAYYGRYEITALLLARGANVNALMTGGNARTPLLNAIWKANNEVAKLLLQHGADATITTLSGQTPCQFARQVGNTQVLLYLPNC